MRIVLVILLMSIISCKKDEVYIYETTPQYIGMNGVVKNNVKTNTEFISIAFADLFGTAIPPAELTKLNTVYSAFGDKKLIEERIVLNMFNHPNAIVPNSVSVNGDTVKFIQQTFVKFYNREANAFEVYYLKEQIRMNIQFKPAVIYYSLMTSDEYRYY